MKWYFIKVQTIASEVFLPFFGGSYVYEADPRATKYFRGISSAVFSDYTVG
jgi:hypothetical protein